MHRSFGRRHHGPAFNAEGQGSGQSGAAAVNACICVGVLCHSKPRRYQLIYKLESFPTIMRALALFVNQGVWVPQAGDDQDSSEQVIKQN